MTELEKLQLAKEYIDKLAYGINPFTNAKVNYSEIINDVKISRCFFYISGLLNELISTNSNIIKKSKTKREFYLDYNQQNSLVPIRNKIKVSDIANKINKITEENECKKFKSTWITTWLLNKGFLENSFEEEYKKNRKIITSLGESIGISIQFIKYATGIFPIIFYSYDAQKFIYDNIEAILNEK